MQPNLSTHSIGFHRKQIVVGESNILAVLLISALAGVADVVLSSQNIAVVAEPPQPPSYAAVALSSYAPPMSLRPPPPAYGSLEGSPPEPNVWRRGAADNVCLTPSAPSYCSSSDDETDICCDAATEAQTPSSCSFPTSSSTAETREEQLASPAMLPLQMYFY